MAISLPVLNAQPENIAGISVNKDSIKIKAKHKIPKRKFRLKQNTFVYSELIGKNPDSLITPWINHFNQWKAMPKNLK